MFIHDGDQDFALNFTAPLLIECGCPFSLYTETAHLKYKKEEGKAEKVYMPNQFFSQVLGWHLP